MVEYTELQLLEIMGQNYNYLRRNYSKLREGYPNRFVVISDGKAICSESNAEKLKREIKK